MNTIPDQHAGLRQRRRAHSDQFKADAVAARAQPGMSMAAVEVAHGINANRLRRWVHQAEMKPKSEVVRANVVDGAKAQEPRTVFVPVSLNPQEKCIGLVFDALRDLVQATPDWDRRTAVEAHGVLDLAPFMSGTFVTPCAVAHGAQVGRSG